MKIGIGSSIDASVSRFLGLDRYSGKCFSRDPPRGKQYPYLFGKEVRRFGDKRELERSNASGNE